MVIFVGDHRIEQGFFHEFALDNKALETFVEFRIC